MDISHYNPKVFGYDLFQSFDVAFIRIIFGGLLSILFLALLCLIP